MKASDNLLSSLSDIKDVQSQGDLRRIVANSLLALARKEISSTDIEAMAKGMDSISNSLNAEVRIAKAKIELRNAGSGIGEITQLGSLLIGDSKGMA